MSEVISINQLVKVFDYNKMPVRTVVVKGNPWWVASDVCSILGLTDTGKSVERLDEDEKGTNSIPTPGGNQEMLIVSESGLYSLILGSRKPEAKQFKRWITHEVIPSIRKHGAYMTPEKIEEVLLNPDTIIQLATELKVERESRLLLEAKVEKDRPKTIFADAVTESDTSIAVGDLAKILKQNGYETGRDRLFAYFREHGWLIKHGISYNLPTQRSMEMKLFEVKETVVVKPDGGITVNKTPVVTGKGQIYFINHFDRRVANGESQSARSSQTDGN